MKRFRFELILTKEQGAVVHAALINLIDSEDHTDAESLLITELLDRMEKQKKEFDK